MIATEINAEFPGKRARARAREGQQKENPKFPGAIAREEQKKVELVKAKYFNITIPQNGKTYYV